jgi:hypothetical protein
MTPASGGAAGCRIEAMNDVVGNSALMIRTPEGEHSFPHRHEW